MNAGRPMRAVKGILRPLLLRETYRFGICGLRRPLFAMADVGVIQC
jgi:hypothetical protein